MTSLRATLIWPLLALMAVVLAVASWIVYEDTRRTLLAREAGMRELLAAGVERHSVEVREQFDDLILKRAQKIASRTQIQTGYPRTLILGVMSTLMPPEGPLPMLAWLAQGVDSPVSRAMQRYFTVVVAEELLPRPGDVGHDQEYCAIWGEQGRLMQHSLTLEPGDLKLDEGLRQSLAVAEHQFEDAQLANGRKVRLVTLKSVVTGVRFMSRSLMVRTAPPQRGAGQRPLQPFESPFFSYPTIFIQYAREMEECQAKLGEIRRSYESDVAALRSETESTLAGLRLRLIIVSLVAFALAAVGGTWLVHRSLAPIGRIAEAVSRVSERDFQLRLERRDTPRELVVIVDKLQATLASLEKAFAHDKQAVADISHELRTPIASLLTTIDVCLRKPRGSDEYRATLQQCSEIANHLSVLVQRLLVLARLDAGVDQPQRELVEVDELARHCGDMLRPLAEADGVTLAVTTRPALAETDPNKLREIITNLVDNAIHYNQRGGKVELVVGKTGEWVEITVRDTGIGISPEVRRHLFERFYRADASRHSETPRAGLGLAIVKGYLDLLGGTIEVASEVGKGSTFRVRLPAATASQNHVALAG
jgi:heavy metal sensor kinase